MSIISTLLIGREALGAQQQAIQTTGHNLANVNTPGFSRQRVELSSARPVMLGRISFGQGVEVDGIRSVVSDFFETQLLNVHGSVGFAEGQNRALAGVEAAFPTSGGIPTALDNFFGALADLANNPAGQAERANVIGKSSALGESLAQTRTILTNVQGQLDKDLDVAVQRVNDLLPRIAKLNREISASEVDNQRANDLRDQRQTLLLEVSKLTGATVHETEDGYLTAAVNGLLLVSDDQAARLDASVLNTLGLRVISYESPNGITADATTFITAGEIGALIAARDTHVPGTMVKLDQFAKALVDAINTQHALGFDLNGVAGGNFFSPIATATGAAAQVQVDGAVVADSRLIATAGAAAGVPGDNGNALALTNIQNVTQAALGNTTLTSYFLGIVSEVGGQTQASENTLDFQQTLLAQTRARRESVSGVSIEEEMTNLVLFQRAFQAASVLVRTGDEMYQTILDMVR
jgi:flagellar hook-associated protein 1 FlgK